ncbi:ankyrin repeat protein, putative [Trichomonas vaginalis G3]|uniref:Ankyrin repeat protein, putative n=1 Tax=Trichomonas vaginalis (strain ATCC PRA-98 / G3) TaxID=412133 RepID=A2FSK8_TRIV3|nr:spectrin binding [Trichomonas vaginalis G3]EAX92109.1 ankyrin repeat protein, putative [Trichomonas vaginalis G3]KAI5548639.1 spectrin binding [Trichomonas vaginalis G3]|eukprot:XP_001305039.1 ankyrin repeat protein [Trichomonas vaginalis G3]
MSEKPLDDEDELITIDTEAETMIMDDDIEKFKNYITQKPIEDIKIKIPVCNACSLIEACAYYGSVNIFIFLNSYKKFEITNQCLYCAIIGGNTDIINECSKICQINSECFKAAYLSHNNKYLEYIFTHDLIDFESLTTKETREIAKAQNLKAVFLLYLKNKNSIIPWCAAFPQTTEILKSGEVELLISDTDKETLLHYAAFYNNVEGCEFLLNHFHASCDDDEWPLHREKNRKGKTPLHLAAQRNSKEAAELLILNGAKVEAKTYQRETPLHEAAQYNSKETVDLLLSHGSKINAEDKLGNLPIHFATEFLHYDMVEYLISHGASINEQNEFGETPLHISVTHEYKEIINLLLSHGANVNTETPDGQSPLTDAAQIDRKDIVELLIAHGANTESRLDEGKTALLAAIERKSKEMVECLLSHGADVNASDSDGRSALHYTIIYKNLDIAKILVSHGANITSKDHNGLTQIKFAQYFKRNEIHDFLVSIQEKHQEK